jgi:hypothetical protein
VRSYYLEYESKARKDAPGEPSLTGVATYT